MQYLSHLRCGNLGRTFAKGKWVCNISFKLHRSYANSKFKLNSGQLVKNIPKIMKLDSPQFKLCITEEVKVLEDLFTKYGYEIRIVGGAVRDLLMGIQPSDLDFSTTATPQQMKRMFEENHYRLINNNGEKHGTVTTRINEKNFEVTTLRIDLTTDGRHAEVQFTKEWALDANRRDLTINAMYLGLDGTLYDYFNGYEDLSNKRLVFVGDASARIKEDFLRIIRYFRFYGKIADVPDSHDEDVLKAIKENVDGLKIISGERIWSEITKIFDGRFAGDIILKMLSLGLGPYIGIKNTPNEEEFKKIWNRLKMKDMKVKPVTLLSALFSAKHELDDLCLRLKLPNIDRDLGYFILNNRKETSSLSIRPYQVLYLNMKTNGHFIYELLKYQGKYDLLEEMKEWKIPVFPVKGSVLLEKGYKGREVGEILSFLRNVWFDHDFNISGERLLEHIPNKKIKLVK